MIHPRKGGDVAVIRRKAGIPLAFRPSQGRELVGLQIQPVDGGRRNLGLVNWPVAKKQRITIPRPVGIKFEALAFGHFSGGSPVSRHDIDVQEFARHEGGEYNLLSIGGPLGHTGDHGQRSELKPLCSIHFAAPES